MRFDIKGKIIEIVRDNDDWVVFNIGEGKKSRSDILIPPDLEESKLLEYLNDYFHELLSVDYPEVKRID